MANLPKIEINLDGPGFGTTAIDGKLIPGVRKLSFVSEVGHVQHVELELLSTDINVSSHGTVIVNFVCPRCDLHLHHDCAFEEDALVDRNANNTAS